MLVKCQLCNLKDTDSKEMVKESKGYYHPNPCHVKFLEHKEFLKKELDEKNELMDVVCAIHKINLQSVPTGFYSYTLEPFRSNNSVHTKINKRYKEGFTYTTIKDTYLYCHEKIKLAIGKKQEQGGFGNLDGELKYCFRIVQNNIENMIRNKRKKENSKLREEKVIEGAKQHKQISERLREKREKIKSNKVKDENEIDFDTVFD
jgi:hypothetical protein